ncbi:hypothetical protein ASA1KI_11270 [Opitutales bacterium ASA1]|uniref:phage integrase N-terminal SAM-like domain-containing protein n=1 Tax=Congregicoccus parvus TaxID=3081749 RepID=UPI002B2DE8CA|nr:hypothetical protein ASA1KI_11270 [Opitutales bacterium ASA1]
MKTHPSEPAAWRQPVSFPGWREVLAGEPVSPAVRHEVASGVIAFLAHCKRVHRPASIAHAKSYLEEQAAGETQRRALRWFFSRHRAEVRGGRKESDTRPVGPIAPDTPEWLAMMIRAVRVRGLRWTSEQSYCGWLRQYARYVHARSPETTGAAEVRTFLESLAVQRLLSGSAQRQALNALVFFFRHALGIDLGDLGEFARGRRPTRMPVVLARSELEALFTALDGTWRLMAQLQYGSGLRVGEVVGLRVGSLDLARGRLIVRAGKGDKDRTSVLAEGLIEPLHKRLDRLRALFEQDRRSNLPGVWLPPGLQRKYPAAGRRHYSRRGISFGGRWRWDAPLGERGAI